MCQTTGRRALRVQALVVFMVSTLAAFAQAHRCGSSSGSPRESGSSPEHAYNPPALVPCTPLSPVRVLRPAFPVPPTSWADYNAACGRVLPRAGVMNTTRQQRNVWRVLIHEGPVAPWRQILEVIRGRISDGTYPAGSRLPSIVDLGHEFGVALTTVRKALDVLKAEGAILTSPMGTFIA